MLKGRSLQAIANVFSVLVSFSLSPAAIGQDALPSKRSIAQLIAPACQQIADHAHQFRAEQIRRATQYYTPLFRPGPDGKLRPEDRRACLNVEGACVVEGYLYDTGHPYGISRAAVPYKFGQGRGKGPYNQTNALDPCRTLAADISYYPIGTVIFIPPMTSKICPQTGKPVDGCFIVGDVGSAIRGRQRFDIFTGECSEYDKNTHSCKDQANTPFVASKYTMYRVISRNHPLAFQLRQEADAFILRDWH